MELLGDYRLSDRWMTEWFLRENALREWERAGAAPVPARKAVITVARQFGAGGHTLRVQETMRREELSQEAAACLVRQVDRWREAA